MNFYIPFPPPSHGPPKDVPARSTILQNPGKILLTLVSCILTSLHINLKPRTQHPTLASVKSPSSSSRLSSFHIPQFGGGSWICQNLGATEWDSERIPDLTGLSACYGIVSPHFCADLFSTPLAGSCIVWKRKQLALECFRSIGPRQQNKTSLGKRCSKRHLSLFFC